MYNDTDVLIYSLHFDLFCLFIWLSASGGAITIVISQSFNILQRILIILIPTIFWAVFIFGKLIIRWLYA